jgi:hypothetical protein
MWWTRGFLVWVAVVACFGCGTAAEPPGREPVGAAREAVCTQATLAFNPGTANPGTPVTLTATAGCGTGDTPTYQFWELAPGSGWTVTQPWSTSATWNWDTTGAAAGTYYFEVWVRAQGSTANYET